MGGARPDVRCLRETAERVRRDQARPSRAVLGSFRRSLPACRAFCRAPVGTSHRRIAKSNAFGRRADRLGSGPLVAPVYVERGSRNASALRRRSGRWALAHRGRWAAGSRCEWFLVVQQPRARAPAPSRGTRQAVQTNDALHAGRSDARAGGTFGLRACRDCPGWPRAGFLQRQWLHGSRGGAQDGVSILAAERPPASSLSPAPIMGTPWER